MPNVVGWSQNEIITFCNLVGLKYDLDGNGIVLKTSIKPGSIINKDEVIDIELSN